jgi:endoglucanase
VTKKALQNGIVPVYWDNGRTDNNNSGLFDRNSGAKAHSEAINAIISGGNN